MALNIVGIHHHAIRIDVDTNTLDSHRDFYCDVLGMNFDEGRPTIAGVPGYWINVGEASQIHLIGGEFPSPVAKGPGQDPAAAHVALAVEDIGAAKAEIERLGVRYWSSVGLAGPEFEQLFLHDPSGNMIELHQVNKCRCSAQNRSA